MVDISPTLYVIAVRDVVGFSYLVQKDSVIDYIGNTKFATKFTSMTEAILRAIEIGIKDYEIVAV